MRNFGAATCFPKPLPLQPIDHPPLLFSTSHGPLNIKTTAMSGDSRISLKSITHAK
jgi:hypothetical protein